MLVVEWTFLSLVQIVFLLILVDLRLNFHDDLVDVLLKARARSTGDVLDYQLAHLFNLLFLRTQ